MARAKGSMKIGENIEPQIGAPLDARLLVKTKADLTNPKSYEYAYVGMKVMVKDELTEYILKAKDTTLEENWEIYNPGVDSKYFEGLATKEELDDYVKKEDINTYVDIPEIDLSTYATKEELLDYTTKEEANSFLTSSDLNGYLTSSDLDDYVQSETLDNYVTKDELSNLEYSSLKGLPKINNKTLVGNLSFNDLGLTINEDGTAELDELKIVTWANGKDNEIVKMVEAADNGEINLYDYWAVGDERKVKLDSFYSNSSIDDSTEGTNPSQDICMVLLNTDENLTGETYSYFYDLVETPNSGRKKPWFIVGMKNCLSKSVRMNTQRKTSGGWSTMPLCTWCNTEFRNAFPDSIVEIFKQFRLPFWSNYLSGVPSTTSVYFAVHSVREIGMSGPNTSNAVAAHREIELLPKFKYYQGIYRKYKKKGGIDLSYSSKQDKYWSRTISGDYGYCNCVPNEYNTAYTDTSYPEGAIGACFFGAI